jgi:hypothetical protein
MFSFLKAAVSGRSGTIAQKYKFEIVGLQMAFNTAPLGDLSASFIRGMHTSLFVLKLCSSPNVRVATFPQPYYECVYFHVSIVVYAD